MTTVPQPTEELRAGPERFAEEVYEEQNLDYIDERFADDWVGHMDGEEMTRAEYREMQADLLEGFPDVEMTFDPVVVEGDTVAGHWEMTGTHTGEFVGLRPTDRPLEVGGTFVNRVDEDGLVVESWQTIDRLGMLQQLGVAPEDFGPRALFKVLLNLLGSAR
jgi:predicted ester cyclase